MRPSPRYRPIDAFVFIQRIFQDLQKSPGIRGTGNDARMHSRLHITFVKLCKFQDHLEGVMPGREVVRVPALCLTAETTRTQLLWHSCLRQRAAFVVPSHLLLPQICKFVKFQMDRTNPERWANLCVPALVTGEVTNGPLCEISHCLSQVDRTARFCFV